MKVLIVTIPGGRVPSEVGILEAVQVGIRSKMKCGRHLFDANIDAVLDEVSVAARFHQVYFARRRPTPVGVVLRAEPNGGMEPVADRHFGVHLHFAVLESERVHGPNLGTFNGTYYIERVSGPFAAPQLGISASAREFV